MAEAATLADPLLQSGDPEPVGLRNSDAPSPFLLICDHAGNAVPAALDGLGLGPADLARHIAFDIGILGVSERLADRIGAPLVFQRYSRLVVECNRLFSSAQSIALTSDGTPIPGNRRLDPAARAGRIAEIAEPYHAEIARRLDQRRDRNLPTILVSMHSFTPSLLSRPFARPWQVALCWGADDRFTRRVRAVLEEEDGLVIGRNEPYSVDMENDYSIPVHGEGRRCPYAEFEIRQDLIATRSGQAEWSERLARVLERARRSFVIAPAPARTIPRQP